MKFTDLLAEIASLVVEVLSELGAFTVFCILFAVIFLTAPIWIVPYAIYKQFKGRR